MLVGFWGNEGGGLVFRMEFSGLVRDSGGYKVFLVG